MTTLLFQSPLYLQPEFDAFGWPACAAEDPGAAYGLDYESAREATPQWFAVSSGNGNDGVSHSFPDYYCRCTSDEAFTLAGAAMITQFDDVNWAADNMTVDGESDYTITAMILNPPEDEPEDPDYRDIAEEAGYRVLPVSRGYENGFAWGTMDSEEPAGSMLSSESDAWEACCEENDLISDDDNDGGSWSDANGAWMLIEVFPVDDFDSDHCRRPTYNSLAACFDSDALKLAAAV